MLNACYSEGEKNRAKINTICNSILTKMKGNTERERKRER